MRYVYWARARTGRLLAILLAIIIYSFLLAVDALHYFPHSLSTNFPYWLPWIIYGFSAFVALMFLAVGALVWLYARNRRVALLLFCFCMMLMVTFAVQTDAALKHPLSLLSTIATIASSLALFLFSILLLFFPKNHLSIPLQLSTNTNREGKVQSRRQRNFILLLWGYIALLTLWSIVVVLHNTFYYFLSPPLSDWLNTIDSLYDIIAMAGILITIIFSYRQSSSLRQRQQQSIFVGGVVLAVAPLLLLTVLPGALSLPSQYIVDPQLSTITLVLLPLALGYTILRYQVLVFDMYIRRAVAWIVGSVGLVVLGYLVFVFNSLLLPNNEAASVISAVLEMAVLGTFVWWIARVVTGRLFFSEHLHYRQLIDNPAIMANETLDLDEASQLLTVAAVNVFETQEVCLFVLEEDTGHYRPCPALKAGDPDDTPRLSLVKRLLSAVKLPGQHIDVDWLEAKELIVKQVARASRPLLLSEASKVDEELPSGLARYLATTSSLDSKEPLLAPVWAQGKMIAILVLGERGDRQQYAGPDFEAIHLILSRFSSLVETARIMVKLRAAYERQKELDRLKDQFIITASHELRTPLTAVQGYVELLAAYNLTLDPESRADFIAKASRGCDELTLMVGNIMDASRVQVEVENVKLSPVSLAESVHHVLEILEAVTRREERDVQVDIPADVLVMADNMRLRQVLLNLLSNALKYSPAGSSFEMSMDMDDEQITVRLRDHGLGVPLEDQERLFERFMRLERDMNSPVRGAGLGLYISKQLVEAMGGRIWVESTGIPGEGSTFTFTLKRSKVSNEPKQVMLERQEV